MRKNENNKRGTEKISGIFFERCTVIDSFTNVELCRRDYQTYCYRF